MMDRSFDESHVRKNGGIEGIETIDPGICIYTSATTSNSTNAPSFANPEIWNCMISEHEKYTHCFLLSRPLLAYLYTCANRPRLLKPLSPNAIDLTELLHV